MPSERLYQQFERLVRQLPTTGSELTLREVAELLCCTPRNARLLLQRMQEQGWLSWQSSAGRGRRARLTLLDSPAMLQSQRLEALVKQGRLEQALLLVDGQVERLLPYLGGGSGTLTPLGQQILRVPYYRPLPNLLPHLPLRRSEIHLVRQIFNGLLRRNEENGEIEPDLAHHWVALSPRHWRFYLRPMVRFHHGKVLQADDVALSLARLTTRPLFAHIERVEAVSPRVVDILLSTSDPWLPHLLCEPAALILPADWQELPDMALYPVGSGPYRVVANDSQRLRLAAFDDYFGLRALIDEIDIWMLPPLAERLTCQLKLAAEHRHPERGRDVCELEAGCYFMLADQRSACLGNAALRSWLVNRLDPVRLLAALDPELQKVLAPARGLLPHWRELPASLPPEGVSLPHRLVLACFKQHLEFAALAAVMGSILREEGVELEVREVDYHSWACGDLEGVDLWLGAVNLEQASDYAVYAWLQELPLLRAVWHEALSFWQGLPLWRSGQQGVALREEMAQLQREALFMPLFHHWLELENQYGVNGVRMTALGWFDFRNAWIAPQVEAMDFGRDLE
ncbi:ABC transporter substrate-binding protein [Aeromonas diversa CDC 2478-85]|uniref:ABC transporter substrate-binding protein n=1 Tax=Aeromonas diversa CDC 2478-85 TaxID=1268237 RepID=N9V8U5_9GAMM|nr:HTH-type transcriptional regulator SgrR [Aeromonas diversa]ENY71672.1 ABC transporter substrate-binding protein [Aeromonas diversa CDC 2478-85]